MEPAILRKYFHHYMMNEKNFRNNVTKCLNDLTPSCVMYIISSSICWRDVVVLGGEVDIYCITMHTLI